jgi:tRNA (guanine37-N1)-methyltransferase
MNVGQDILGNLVILKFGDDVKVSEKKKFAEKLLKKQKNVRTVLEKTDRFKGRLRTLTTKHLTGEKTKEVLYRENDCLFRFNVDSCYFSSRLSSERKEVAEKIKKRDEVLVMFGGVAPFAIVIGKMKKPKKVVSVELGRECSKYAKINVERNKLGEIVEVIQGDVRKKLPFMKEKFSKIIMARPNLKDSFLDVAFPLIKKKGIIYYYGFYQENKVEELKELIISEAKKAKKKIKILGIKKTGDIAPYKYRYRADVKILN